jgi:hypothetical protein
MICPVKLATEMSGLSGALNSGMTRCGHERNGSAAAVDRAMKLEGIMLPTDIAQLSASP